MPSNFNLVKKPKKDENEFDDEEDEDIELDDNESLSDYKSKEDPAKKRLIMLMGIIVIGTILLLFILYIASLFGKKSYTYEDVETIMKDAAVGYFAAHPEYLPQNEGDIVEVDSVNLVAEGRMNDLSSYFNTACTGTVQVEKMGTDYFYTPFLNCGNNYSTVELARKVMEDNPTVREGDGLYSFNNNYVFRGENVNNYVQLDNSLWRIVKINEEGNLVMIHANGLPSYKAWDDRFNEDRNYEAGVNRFAVSRIKDYLSNVYAGKVDEEDEKILSDKDRSRLVSYDLCIGKRSVNSESKNNSEECRQKSSNTKLGLLTLSDYLYASIDTNCRSASTRSCTNYNYLKMSDEWWLATADADTDYSVYKVDRSGIVRLDIASTYSLVRPVIHLNSRVMTSGGKGTLDEPYLVK